MNMPLSKILNERFPNLKLEDGTPWGRLTTLGIGQACPCLVEPSDPTELEELLKFCHSEKVNVFFLGAGSNLLGSDETQNILVIRLCGDEFKKVEHLGASSLRCGSGIRLKNLFQKAAEFAMGAAAPLAGIPGTLGGAIKMNAGAEGVEIGDFVEIINGFKSDGTPHSIQGKDLIWNYRHGPVPDDFIVTEAILKLKTVEPEEEISRIKEVLERRATKSPKGKNAGCVFKNPSLDTSAGQLIDSTGCKSKRAGDAIVSDIHANYFINQAAASENDFLGLAREVAEQVWKLNGICLRPELRCVNPNSDTILRNFNMNKIAVLKGGDNSEREVSLESGAAVANALRQAGYQVDEIDVKSPEITPAMMAADAVFPVLHGGFGENGVIQKAMEDAGVAFVGCPSRSCAEIMDKVISKEIMTANNITTAPYAVMESHEREFPENMSLPVVVKPPSEGSTMGVTIVHTMDEWLPALENSLKYCDQILVEKYIKGREITVGMINGEPLPLVEIQYPGEMYDYDAKYTHEQGETLYLCPPPEIPMETQTRAQEIAVDFYKASKARDLLRVDIIIGDDDGGFYVLEANNMPGFTSSSLLPKAAKAAGLSFPSFCAKLVKMALERKSE